MFPNSPEKIVSFEVVPVSCLNYFNGSGDEIQSLNREHVVALDSEGRLWARILEETSWTCLNFPQAQPGDQ